MAYHGVEKDFIRRGRWIWVVLKRKIYDKLLQWKKTCGGTKAVMVEGARRIGKSTVCEEFGKREYKSYILVDFSRVSEEVKGYFEKYLNDLDTFFMLLSTAYGKKLYERKSVIIFDEVQMYPRARAAIKHLVADGRYDYIETGSLISIKENVKDIVIPSEERRMKMYPLDFLIIRSFIFIYSLIIRIFIIMSYDNYVKLFLFNMYHGQMLGCFSQLFWHPPREK